MIYFEQVCDNLPTITDILVLWLIDCLWKRIGILESKPCCVVCNFVE